LAFRDFSLLSYHFWPFTGVLRKIFRSLTRESLGIFEQPAFAEATARQATDYPPSPDGYGGQAADVTD
jgi:hypothetical protein